MALDVHEEIRAERRRREQLRQAKARRDAAGGGGGNQGTTQKTGADRSGVLGTPFIRKGESVLTSRGYCYSRLAALMAGLASPDDCKVELSVKSQLDTAMRHCPGFQPSRNAMLCPLVPAFLMGEGASTVIDHGIGREITQKMWAGTLGFDADEASWISAKYGVPDTTKTWNPDTARASAQSALTQSLGGAVVPFPELGPLIPLFRNKNALLNAGAQLFPLPPSGRFAWPRQTGPSTVYHVGEGQAGTQTNLTTDQFTLAAKKLIALLTTNNELLRYGGPIVEQMFRNDLMISMALQVDYDGLQGAGSDTVIAGLIGYPGVQTFNGTGSGTVTNGYTLAPGDIYTMSANVFAANAEFEGWIIRPELWGAIQGKRAAVLASGDNLGLFLFNVTRGLDSTGTLVDQLGGYKVTRSANAPANRKKGTGTNLTTLYGGMWSDYMIGMYGTIELAISTQGDTVFSQDQSAYRAVLSCDAGPKHPGAYICADQLLPTTVGQ